MARPTTYKTVQVQVSCSCGRNDVFEEDVLARFKDLSKREIRYKKDQSTGKYFFTKKEHQECSGHEEEQY